MQRLALIVAAVVAFVVGLGLWLHFHPAPPPGFPVVPHPVVGPSPIVPPSPPAATATVATRTRVVIDRPVYPPPAGRPLPGGPVATGGGVDGSPQPDPSPWMEHIEIVTEGGASAEAPLLVPSPPPVAVVVAPPTPGPLPVGVAVGTFPGYGALDWEAVRVEPAHYVPITGLAGLSVGADIVLNAQMGGVGGNASWAQVSPHLYLEAGYYQEFKPSLDPRPFVALGWRL